MVGSAEVAEDSLDTHTHKHTHNIEPRAGIISDLLPTPGLQGWTADTPPLVSKPEWRKASGLL